MQVFDFFKQRGVPEGIELIDGGLRGLNLIRDVQGAECVIFVDSMRGFAAPRKLVVIEGQTAAGEAEPSYGHSSGLAYLLKAVSILLPNPPRSFVVGMQDHTPDDIPSVAKACLRLVQNEEYSC